MNNYFLNTFFLIAFITVFAQCAVFDRILFTKQQQPEHVFIQGGKLSLPSGHYTVHVQQPNANVTLHMSQRSNITLRAANLTLHVFKGPGSNSTVNIQPLANFNTTVHVREVLNSNLTFNVLPAANSTLHFHEARRANSSIRLHSNTTVHVRGAHLSNTSVFVNEAKAGVNWPNSTVVCECAVNSTSAFHIYAKRGNSSVHLRQARNSSSTLFMNQGPHDNTTLFIQGWPNATATVQVNAFGASSWPPHNASLHIYNNHSNTNLVMGASAWNHSVHFYEAAFDNNSSLRARPPNNSTLHLHKAARSNSTLKLHGNANSSFTLQIHEALRSNSTVQFVVSPHHNSTAHIVNQNATIHVQVSPTVRNSSVHIQEADSSIDITAVVLPLAHLLV